MRLRRLRQPRYLLGAIVGVAYLYFTVFAPRRRRPSARAGRGGSASLAAVAPLLAGAPPIVGTGLFGVAAAAWLLPFDSGLLDFSDAEVDFLFTAPVSRSQLVVHRLLRSQIGLLFGSIVPVIFYPGLSGVGRVRSSLALWLLFVTMRVYFCGVTLARRGFAAANARARRAAIAPAALIGVATAAAGTALARAFVSHPAANIRDALFLVRNTASDGGAHAALAPCIALVRPLFAVDGVGFVAALGPAVLILAVVSTWLIGLDRVVHEAGVDSASPAGSEEPRRAVTPTLRAAPWTLAPSGRPELALAWRAAVEMVRGTGGRSLIRPLAGLLGVGLTFSLVRQQRGVAQLVAVLAVLVAAGVIVLGPQLMRMDLRQDLRNIDLLKTWPIQPVDVVRGEIVWPATVLTVLSWIAVTVALIFSGGGFGRVAPAWRVGIALAVAAVAPALIAAQLTIHNAAALTFPAWIATGGQRPRGLDALGQRLIMLAATMLLLALMLVPAIAAGGAVWLAFRGLLGAAALPPAALLGSATVFLEVLVATEAMGPLYEKLDLAEVERSET